MQKLGIKVVVAALCSMLLSGAAAAVPETLIPGGNTIGLELQLDGVSVVELANDIPAKAGLRCGDLICRINDTAIQTIEQLTQQVQSSQGKPLQVTVLRSGEKKTITLSPIETADGWKLGIYVRDRLGGIGTVTYYEAEDGDFGALGHGVSGGEGTSLLPLRGGSVLPSEVASVVKGQCGTPGSLQGAVKGQESCGQVELNTPQGIFGTMEPIDHAPIPVGDASQVHKGAAEIRSTVHGTEVQSFSVQICQIHETESHDRNLLIRVTDPTLLSTTGGIVQGMSGSPIIQDGKLIGAVTHVLIDDPTQGYGIFIENMLDAAG
ncbi:MAG: PDZ domain-containing protein [Oscillospiraceae bacterium]|nr:PDZ domain-containing protein [Oscillospiraceae bacterium]